MKIIVTTSNKYLHLMPVFVYLFQKYWPGEVCEVVGYTQPKSLPADWTFVSMGKQGNVTEWSTDLRRYFENQPEWFIWLMEDTFIKRPVNEVLIKLLRDVCQSNGVGKIALTNEGTRRPHDMDGLSVFVAKDDSIYRLSTQPAIWNRYFLLYYMLDGLTPWKFETQSSINDGWSVVGPAFASAVIHNEGVRKHDVFDLNVTGMHVEDINFINQIQETWERLTKQ